ncbi:flagellar motor protein MotA [Rhodovibrio salinarum]|uniref:flagellar motor protein MotA n=1 Tax=Rhodovibrio salinarum TaxID=1087 RepID=UPI0004B84CEE|nr:flagellar motor protein MotA [Rhodovibrio salinarum]
MSQPRRFLIRMLIFLAIVVGAAVMLLPQLKAAFMGNPLFNGLILGVLLLGIIYIFRQVLLLRPEVEWIERFRSESQGQGLPSSLQNERPPRLLSPLANMMGEQRRGRMSLSTLSMRSLLDGISSRINESHEISRYLIGLLIFLGLLGTFWGLLETVNSVAGAISDLSASGQNPAALFGQLKTALQQPLQGMGTAFSSSLFGLAGSLVLGFLELQAGQAHNRFMNELEEWLSSITKLSSGGMGEGAGAGESVPAYIQALLEQTADSLDTLQRTISGGEEDRAQINRNLMQLTERLTTLTDQMRTEQSVLMRVAETQSQLKPILGRIADAGDSEQPAGGMDDATKDHIRNLDVRLERLLSDQSQGRDQVIKEIRNEIRLLARTIAAIAEETDQPQSGGAQGGYGSGGYGGGGYGGYGSER